MPLSRDDLLQPAPISTAPAKTRWSGALSLSLSYGQIVALTLSVRIAPLKTPVSSRVKRPICARSYTPVVRRAPHRAASMAVDRRRPDGPHPGQGARRAHDGWAMGPHRSGGQPEGGLLVPRGGLAQPSRGRRSAKPLRAVRSAPDPPCPEALRGAARRTDRNLIAGTADFPCRGKPQGGSWKDPAGHGKRADRAAVARRDLRGCIVARLEYAGRRHARHTTRELAGADGSERTERVCALRGDTGQVIGRRPSPSPTKADRGHRQGAGHKR